MQGLGASTCRHICQLPHSCCLCAQIDELQAQVSKLQGALSDAERRVLEGEMVRRKLHNVIQVRCTQDEANVISDLVIGVCQEDNRV